MLIAGGGVAGLETLLALRALAPDRLDITILAPDLAVTVDVARMRSKSKNTPFGGWTLRGGVAATIVGGRTVFVNSELADFNLKSEA